MSKYLGLLLFVASSSVHADWGRGLWGGSNCNQRYEPAPQAYSANDELSNMRGQVAQDNREIRNLEAQLNRIPERIEAARRRMTRVVSPEGFAAIEEHYSQRREHDAYRKGCAPTANADANKVPVPNGFCYENPQADREEERYVDLWDRVADMDRPGRVIDSICQRHIPVQGVLPSEADQRECTQGLNDYYSAQDEKARLTQQIAELRRRVEGYDARIGRISRDVTESGYCASCFSERRGYSTNSTGDQMMDMVVPLMVVGAAMLSSSQRQRSPPALVPAYGGDPQVPYRAYPARPYAARVPGYYGVHNGVYGAAPGSIGRGAFGCNNSSPLSFGDSSFGNDLMSIFNGPSPFNSPHAAPFMNPVATNRLFNPGFGPGFRPRLGGRGPFNGPLARGRNARALVRPINGRMPITQMPQRFGQIPGTVIGGRPGFGFGFGNQPVSLPFQHGGFQQSPMFPGYPRASLLSQYGGANQFYNAPATAGYRGGGPLTSVSNVPGLTQNVLGNYVHQMNQISQNIQMLGGGSYYAPPTASPTQPTPTNPTGPGVVTPVKKK